MNLQLKELRIAAGYDRPMFARMVGVTARKLKAWEVGETKISLRDAVICADALGCTLDELAGREVRPSLADAQAAAVIDAYYALTPEGRDTALTVVRGVLASEAARGSAAGVPSAVSAS